MTSSEPGVLQAPRVGPARRLARGVRRRLRRAVRDASRLLHQPLSFYRARLLRIFRPGLATEERLLRQSWAKRSPDLLDNYLVTGYQNPRINAQSILLRHALVHRLFGSRFEPLMRAELDLAVELNEALRLRAAELGVRMGSYLDERQARVRRVGEVIADRERTFEGRWTKALAPLEAPPIRILELACGSANDYRAFADYGLAPFLDYAGIDLTVANIENARRRFPGVRFEVGNAMAVDLPDASFDVVIASDLFEHLSLEGMEQALGEVMRLARDEIVVTFFNMADQPDHANRPQKAYHWNRLSRPRIEAALRVRFPDVTVTPIAAWLEREHGYEHSYNPGAYTIIARRGAA